MNILPVKLPDVGEGVTEAELAEWHVKVGDIVKEDDVIAAVMTDKATVEIPSLYTGKVVELGGEVGDILSVGTNLVMIETDATVADTQKSQAETVAAKEPEPQSPDKAKEPPSEREPAAAPASRSLAGSLGPSRLRTRAGTSWRCTRGRSRNSGG